MMRAILSLLLLATATQVAAEQARTPNIIVTGIPVSDYRAALEACLARNCPPNEDIDATLALAEALLFEGEYRDARTAVRASLRRNRDEVSGYAEPISDLWRANARLSRNIGYDQEALRSTYQILDTLQEGIPEEDHRHFTARLEIATLELRMGRLPSARRELDELIAAARAAGRDDVAALAEMRHLLIDYVAAPGGSARRRIEQIAYAPGTAEPYRSVAARILLARILRDEGKAEEADAMLDDIATANAEDGGRNLLYSPQYVINAQMVYRPTPPAFIPISRGIEQLTEDFDNLWIDVGFWVLPDGRVSGLEVVRHGGDASWARPLIESIEGRRYSTADHPDYRLERYTLTAGFGASTGTRMRRQNGPPRVEYFDLSAGQEYPAPPPAPATG